MWKKLKLGEITNISIGKTPSRSDKRYWDADKNTKNIWLSIADLNSLEDGFVSDSKEYVSDAGAALFKPVPANTLIMSFKLSIGKLAFTSCELRTNEAIAALEIKDENKITKEYLRHFLSSRNWDKIAGNDIKVKGKTLNKAKLKELEIIVPPLVDQQRIVVKLDAAFAEIDEAIDLSEKHANGAKIYGYRVIQNMLEELTKIHGKSYLSDIAIIQPQKKLALEKVSEHDEVSFMAMEGLGIEKKYSKTEINKPLKDVYKSYQYFEDDDVVFAKITPCFENGKLSIVSGLTNGIGFGSSEFVVLRTNAKFNSEFLYYCLLDEVFREEGKENMSGAVGHKRVTKEYFYNYDVPTPPLDVQQLTVKKFDEVWKNTRTIVSTKHKKIQELTNLKSAILAQELQSSEAT